MKSHGVLLEAIEWYVHPEKKQLSVAMPLRCAGELLRSLCASAATGLVIHQIHPQKPEHHVPALCYMLRVENS